MRAHRVLYSFPTRRSSDLLAVMGCIFFLLVMVPSECSTTKLLSIRSEEHTSELQSHLNLVCRLLLEKKKQSLTELVTLFANDFFILLFIFLVHICVLRIRC